MKKIYTSPIVKESLYRLRYSLLAGSNTNPNVSPTNPSGYHDHKDYPEDGGWHGGWQGGWGH